MPDAAGVGSHVIAKDAFLDCADALDGISGTAIHGIGFQLHAHALERLEGVAEHQELGFGVDGRALEIAGDPGGTDFDAVVGAIDIHVARAADRLIGLAVYSGKRECGAGLLRG